MDPRIGRLAPPIRRLLANLADFGVPVVASEGDSATLPETLTMAAEQVEAMQPDGGEVEEKGWWPTRAIRDLHVKIGELNVERVRPQDSRCGRATMTQNDREYGDGTPAYDQGRNDEVERDNDPREAGKSGRTGRLSAFYFFVSALLTSSETVSVLSRVRLRGGNWVDVATTLAHTFSELLILCAIVALGTIVLAPRSFWALSTKWLIMATMAGTVLGVSDVTP